MSTAATPASSKKAAAAPKESPAEQLIRDRLNDARRAIWWSEISRVVLKVVIAFMAALLAWLVMDHWIYSPPPLVRLVCFSALVLVTVWYLARRTLPVLTSRVTPEYAAWALEQDHPDYRQQLTSYVTLKEGDASGGIRARVVRVIGSRAASLLKAHDSVPAETIGTFRWWMVAAAMFAVLIGYCVASPKSSVASAKRLFVPLADIAPARRVEIRDVQPGHSDALAGRPVAVSAEVLGVDEDEWVLCRWQGEGPGEEFELVFDEQTRRHVGELLLPHSASGRIRYSLHAGDAEAGPFNLDVENVPVVAVQSVYYEPPKYTRRKPYTASSPSVSTIDGATVRLNIKANRPVARAELQFNPKSVGGTVRATGGQRAIEIAEDGVTLSVSFVARSSRERSTSVAMESYRVLVWDSNDQSNPDPIVYPVKVIPDLPPEVSIVVPAKSPVEVPASAQQIIEVHAMDADFELQEVSLKIRRGIGTVAEPLIWLRPKGGNGKGNQVAVYRFRPQEHKLLAGDVVRLTAIAVDNREVEGNDSLQPNIAETDPLEIRIVEDVAELPEDPVGNDGLSKPDDQPASEASEKGGEGSEGGGEGGGEGSEGGGEGSEGGGEGSEGGGEGSEGGGEGSEGGGEGSEGGGEGSEGGGEGSEGGGEGSEDGGEGSEDGGEGSKGGGSETGASDSGGMGQEDQGGPSAEGANPDGTESDPSDTGGSGDTGGKNASENGGEGEEEGGMSKGGGEEEQTGAGTDNGQGTTSEGESDGQTGSSQPDSAGGDPETGQDSKGSTGGGEQPDSKGPSGQSSEGESASSSSGDQSSSGQNADGQNSEGADGSTGDETSGGAGSSQQSASQSGDDSNSGPPKHDGDAFERIKDYIEKKQQEEKGTGSSGSDQSESGESEGDSESERGSGESGEQQRDVESETGTESESAEEKTDGQGETGSDQADGPQGEESDQGSTGEREGDGQSSDNGSDRSDDSGQPKSPQDKGGEAGESGEPEGDSGRDPNQASGNDPSTGNPDVGDSNSGGVGDGNGSAEDLSEDNAEPPPPPDLEYAKQATDMVLEYLNENRDAVDEDLLETLNWTEGDLARFRDRWESARQMGQSPSDTDSSGNFAEALQSLGLQKERGPGKAASRSPDGVQNLRDSGNRRKAPPAIRDAFEAFRRRQ